MAEPSVQTDPSEPARRPRRWPVVVVIVVVVAVLALQLGGAFKPRTDLVTTVALGQTFVTGPYEFRFDDLTMTPQEYIPDKVLVEVTATARLLDTTTTAVDKGTIWIRLPDGTRVDIRNDRVGDFVFSGTPMQPQMPPRPYEVTFEVPAGAFKAGDTVIIEVADLVLRYDDLNDRDSWQQTGRVHQLRVGPLKPAG
ncbi:MAG: hypothetical protein L0G99_16085 [Propionibacteriales bacterium]|nr:hypothetical protein [Propionibacteriales bacterium]